MVRGKRTGAIPVTVFFEEDTRPNTELAVQRPPLRAPHVISHAERIKQGLREFQRAQEEELQRLREEKATEEWNEFREQQKVKTDELESALASKLAKKEEKGVIEGAPPVAASQPLIEVGVSESKMDTSPSTTHPDTRGESTISMEVDKPSTSEVTVEGVHGPSLTSSFSVPTSSSAPNFISFTSNSAPSTTSLLTSQPQTSDEEEKTLIVAHRLKLSQLRLEAISRKEKATKIESIFEVLGHLTEEEVKEALLMLGDDEFDVIEEFNRYPELRELRRKIAQQRTEEDKKNKKKVKRTASGVASGSTKKTSAKKTSKATSAVHPAQAETSASTTTNVPAINGVKTRDSAAQAEDPQLDAIAALLPHGTDLNYERPPSPKQLDGALDEDAEGGNSDEEEDSNEETFELGGEDFATRTHKKKKHITVKKLKLDDAIAQGSMEGWSSARIRAWNVRHDNPNAYYYRFNHPGEVQRNGKWTQAERERFFARMTEVGVNGQWGIFAKEIYGRVGYQCANFYRQMIENNEIEDPRYVVDESGKAHFLFSKRKKGAKKGASSASLDGDDLEDDEEGGGGANASDIAAGMTRIIRDGREIYIPKINVPVRRSNVAPDDPVPSSRRKTSAKRSAVKVSTNSTSTLEEPNAEEASNTSAMDVSTTASETGELNSSRTNTNANGEKEESGKDASSSKAERAKVSQDPRVKKKSTKKRKRGAGGSGGGGGGGGDDDDGDVEYKPASSWTKERVDREAVRALKSRLDANPLPDFKDVITNVEIIQPTISPYGHVLSYSTWLKCLASDPKNTCPFTKKPLKKRDLVVLTWENIAAYQDKIDRSGQP